MKTSTCSKLFSAFLALAMFTSACGSPSAIVAKSNLQRITSPEIPIPDAQTLVDGNNTFALDLYQSLRSRDGNLIFSSFSISLALAMTYAGARGETESQMANTMHFALPQNQLHPAFNSLDQDLARRGQPQSNDEVPFQLNIVNSVWAEQTFHFLPEYLDLLAQNYGAGIQLADFLNESESVRKQINNSVSKETKDKIKDLLAPGILNPDTKMVLVNAIYFKADWQTQFDPTSTRDIPFHLLDGSETQVKTMFKSMYGLPYLQGEGFQAVELSYQGGTAAMDIVVPDEGDFNEIESALDNAKLNDILTGMRPAEKVELGLPKFNFTSDFNLSDQLTGMGMTDAFDRDRADFSGMTGGRDLFIDNVVHKAFVAVDEKGTEAAAATAVIMAPTSAMAPGLALIIDRPFIFLIRDIPSGQILFVGRVLNPSK